MIAIIITITKVNARSFNATFVGVDDDGHSANITPEIRANLPKYASTYTKSGNGLQIKTSEHHLKRDLLGFYNDCIINIIPVT